MSICEQLRRPENERHPQQVADLGPESFLVLPGTTTFGIVLYDHNEVAIGAYRGEHKEHIALIASDDPTVVEWASGVCE